jgi:hypothetical protein
MYEATWCWRRDVTCVPIGEYFVSFQIAQRLPFSCASVLQTEFPEEIHLPTVFEARTGINFVCNDQDVVVS